MAGISYRLFFRDTVSEERIRETLRCGNLTPDRGEWRKSEGTAHAWTTGQILEPLYPHERAVFEKHFPGAPSVSGVDIQSSGDDRGKLAVEVACLCAELGPFLVFGWGGAFTPEACHKLKAKQRGFEGAEPSIRCDLPAETG